MFLMTSIYPENIRVDSYFFSVHTGKQTHMWTDRLPTTFLKKIQNLSLFLDLLISWTDSGNSFMIKNQAEFSRDLLPYYYKHSNMASFIR